MDSKQTSSHVEDLTTQDPNITRGLLIHNAEREKGLVATAWEHKRIIAMGMCFDRLIYSFRPRLNVLQPSQHFFVVHHLAMTML